MTKNKLIIYAGILVIAIIWAVVAARQVNNPSNQERVVNVGDLEGDVKAVTSNGLKMIKAFRNMRLVQGDKIITGEKSWASLKIDKDKEIMVSEKTSLSFDEVAGTQESAITTLALEAGKVWSNIREKLNRDSAYEIKTPTATMGVRGTKFYVDASKNQVKLAVLDGTVASSTTITTIDHDGRIKAEEVTLLVDKNKQIDLAKDEVTSKETLTNKIKQVTVSTFDIYTLKFLLQKPNELEKGLLDEINEYLKIRSMEESLVKEGKVQLKGTVNLSDGSRNRRGGHIHVRDSAGSWVYYGLLNEDGEFIAGNLPDGSYWLRADPEADGEQARSNEVPFKIVNGKADRDVDAALNRIQFTVTMLSPKGEPVREGYLYIRDAQGHWIYYAEIEKGLNTFYVGGLNDGTYDILAYPSPESEFALSGARGMNINNGMADTSNVSIKLNSPQIAGKVLLASGKPANSIGHVHVRDEQGKWLQYIRLDSGGGFKIGGLKDGRYWLRADLPDAAGEKSSNETEVILAGSRAAPAEPTLVIGE